MNVTLLTIYDKNEIDNVSDEYIKWLVSEIKKQPSFPPHLLYPSPHSLVRGMIVSVCTF